MPVCILSVWQHCVGEEGGGVGGAVSFMSATNISMFTDLRDVQEIPHPHCTHGYSGGGHDVSSPGVCNPSKCMLDQEEVRM